MPIKDPFSKASTPHRVTFLDLSRELRDYCYELALTASLPIKLEPTGRGQTTASDVQNIASNLLQCNTVIASEAASILYSQNIFVFAGDWTWVTLVTWLENIGSRNCAFLSSIELLFPHRRSLAWQKANGDRISPIKQNSQIMEPAFPRNRHLFHLPDSKSEGIVEIIHPAIETFFKLVGNERRSKLSLVISLRAEIVPGLVVEREWEEVLMLWFTMDLPYTIEKLRSIYAADSVQVMWKCQMVKDLFLEKREKIQTLWKILHEEEYDYIREILGEDATVHYMKFTLSIREIPKLLLAAEPCHEGTISDLYYL